MGQQASRQSDTSSQTIHDADTLISTSGSSNEELGNDADRVVEEESKAEDQDEMEWVQETSRSLLEACESDDWDTFEKFLSDESIPKRKKKLVLKEEEECRNEALRWGAPLAVIKYLIDIEGSDAISSGECSWLHTALMCRDTTFEVVKLLVDIGGKDLVMMQSNHPEHRRRTALHIHLGGCVCCPKPAELKLQIMEFLLRVGGMELLEIEDEDGYRVVDYCLEHERKVIVKCLESSYEENFDPVQKHVRSLQSVKVTPKQIEYWIWQSDYVKLKNFLDNEEESEESKQRCFNYRDSQRNGVAFLAFCLFHGPRSIAERIIDLMGTEFLMTTDNNGNTCLHEACACNCNDENIERRHELIDFLIEHGGPALLSLSNEFGETALHQLLRCNRVNFDSITLMADVGGKDFLLKSCSDGYTVLHSASMKEEPNKDVLLYLISVGGFDLRKVKDRNGKKAEDYWSPELKEYIDLCTKPTPALPALSDDLQCPICFEIMNDVHIIPHCCHRFCKMCITDAFQRNKKCPVCRAEYTIGEVRRDLLLCRFALLVQDKENELKKANEKNDALLEEKKDELTKAKEEIATLKRKYNQM
ncbi:hypothetical protein CTEN210_05324 [Chaetoceros tenuissimus]|uniref:RING-type domain-containing protein n=1 Tax=Chaetoceros tenuissimus TaxID=426638 RepID=A0AAD3CMT8_9STRA|nr:hypothetical protein CTEN210_05324 [Chaetoceros tenuissimus]